MNDMVGCTCWFWNAAEHDWTSGWLRAWSVGHRHGGSYPSAVIQREFDDQVVVAWADDVSFAEEKPVRRGKGAD